MMPHIGFLSVVASLRELLWNLRVNEVTKPRILSTRLFVPVVQTQRAQRKLQPLSPRICNVEHEHCDSLTRDTDMVGSHSDAHCCDERDRATRSTNVNCNRIDRNTAFLIYSVQYLIDQREAL